MADNEVLIQIKADVADINAKLSDIKGNIGKVTDETKKMGSESKSQWELMAAGIASTIYIVQQVIQKFQQCATMVTDLAAAYGRAEMSGLKLNAVLSAHNVGDLTDAYKAYAKEVEGLTGIHHVEIENLETILTTMGVMPSQMQPAIEAAIALHNVFGKDLTSSAELVAQAMEGNVRGLQKLIPSLKGAEAGSMSAAQVLDILKKSFGDVNEAIGDAYVTKIEKLKSSWLSFKEEAIDSLIPALKTALDLMTALVKSAVKAGGGVTVDPETGEIIQGGPLTGMSLAGGAQGLPAPKTIKPISDEGFEKSPSHLDDALKKRWAETKPGLEATTFQDTFLTSGIGSGGTLNRRSALEGTPQTGTDAFSSLQFDDIMDPLAAKATKLSLEFKKAGGAQGIIDALLFGQMNAADIKESLEMIETNWKWFEKSTAEQSFSAMNKALDDEWQITKGLNEANRERKAYDISAVDLINAQILATESLVQVEIDRYNAMRSSGADPAALNAQVVAIDRLREKVKDLNVELSVTEGTFASGFVQGLKKFSDQIGNAFQQAERLAQDCSGGMRDTFKDIFVDGMQGNLKTLGDYWQAFLNRMIAAFATAMANIVQQWISAQLELTLKSIGGGGGGINVGSLLGMGGGGGAAAEFGMADFFGQAAGLGMDVAEFAGLFHRGGMANESSSYRLVPSLAFAGAPRYHIGIGPDERAAILRKDEGVFTPGQMKALGLLAKTGGGGNAQPPATNVQFTINTIDSKSFDDYVKKNSKSIINVVDTAIKDNSGLRHTIKRFTK
jgi:hypothetical protein